MQLVQLVVFPEHVAQLLLQGVAVPFILTYPSGAVLKQLLLGEKYINDGSQLKQVVTEEQLMQLMLALAQDTH